MTFDDPDVKLILQIASNRLDETITQFAANKAVSDCCQQDKNPLLCNYVNKNQFWRTTYAAFQTSLFINIAALVDKRLDCSTFQTAAKHLDEQKPDLIPESLFENLKEIRERYEVFRHKVFAHTDHNRELLAKDFDEAGFSWESIQADIKTLDFIRQVLWAVFFCKPIPSREETSFNLTIAHFEALQIEKDVGQLFNLINNGLSKLA